MRKEGGFSNPPLLVGEADRNVRPPLGKEGGFSNPPLLGEADAASVGFSSLDGGDRVQSRKGRDPWQRRIRGVQGQRRRDCRM